MFIALDPKGYALLGARSLFPRLITALSYNPVRHRSLVMHHHGFERLEPFTAEIRGHGRQHLLVNQETDAAIR